MTDSAAVNGAAANDAAANDAAANDAAANGAATSDVAANDAAAGRVSFGLKTTPMHTTYPAILRSWLQADEVPEIDHAWLWDHMLPLSGPRDGPVFEGWTLLAALAAQTRRLRLGLLVTNSQIRQPAVLGKMASTVDVISGGRLVLGLGAGGMLPAGQPRTPDQHPGLTEYLAYGLPVATPSEAIERLTETITIVRRMFTEDVFDYVGRFNTLTGTRNEPKPAQPGGPPVLVGCTGPRMLRLVAEHADIWNVPGPPHGSVEFAVERSALLDRYCAAIGRDPDSVIRSVQVILQADDAAGGREVVSRLIESGFSHIVLAVRSPAPANIARWLADEVINPVRERLPV